MDVQVKLILIWMVSHEDSFWQRQKVTRKWPIAMSDQHVMSPYIIRTLSSGRGENIANHHLGSAVTKNLELAGFPIVFYKQPVSGESHLANRRNF